MSDETFDDEFSDACARPRRVLFIVQNLPVPFDRRVWQEANELAADRKSTRLNSSHSS